jgi:multidrug efflux system membrane fusion protein
MLSRDSLHIGAISASLLLILFLCGCDDKQAEAVVAQPTAVTVSQPIQKQVADFVEFTGNTEAYKTLEMRARVKGFLKKIDFADGANVKEGDVLFEIEPDIYQAQVDSATAALDAAKAKLEKSDADLAIKKEMAAGNAASKLDVIQAQAAVDISKADVELCNAQLTQANTSLGYTKIKSELTGRIDKSSVDEGNLVGSDGNTLLATIVASDPIYVWFDVDEATVQSFQQRMLAKGVKLGTSAPDLPIMMALGDSDDFIFPGTIDYVDNKVDPSTGTIKVRAILKNEKHLISPGFFARVRVPNGDPYQAVLIPERAIGVDQGQKYVMVVNDKNVVEFRPIETGTQQGQMRVIKGLMRTRPGATVAPEKKEISLSGAAPATAPTTQPQS